MEKRNIHEDTKREKKDIGGSLYVFACVCVLPTFVLSTVKPS